MNTKDELKAFFTEHWKYMVVSAACKLNLFDEVQQGNGPINIAQKNQWDLRQLSVLFDALCETDFLIKTENGFKLNERSELLTEDHPDSLKYAAYIWSDEHMDIWQQLPQLIQTGSSPFLSNEQQTYFEYLESHPNKLVQYHRAMSEYAREDYAQLNKIIDFSGYASIMDVGGGFGTLLHIIKSEWPTKEYHLFDLENVIKHIHVGDIQLHKGDFLQSIPSVAEVIILSRILHDWNDEKASQILKNCFHSLPLDGTLIIIENCTDQLKSNLPLLSLNMALMCNSFERTIDDFKSLAHVVGFQLKETQKLNDLQTILIFKK